MNFKIHEYEKTIPNMLELIEALQSVVKTHVDPQGKIYYDKQNEASHSDWLKAWQLCKRYEAKAEPVVAALPRQIVVEI